MFIRTGKLFFIFSACLLMFWVLARLVDVYRFAFVGAVFEILWLPALALLVILPILSFIFWRDEHYKARSFNLFSILIVLFTVLLMIFL
ncbi:MAG: hypothetical protein KTQ13_02170 [Ferruginibacter sp.]|nr:hypothetical protein [Chitinophagaceae bacterium]MBP6285568.1 hypothetical protein [Ferruginibacter sp.]MBU9935430.1 hypothetical protein [Ferruginibacter sp.]HQY12839.1 hypothetical protein [Ferruginibacter sp.]